MKRLILLLALCSAAFSQTAQFPGSVVTDSQLGVAANNITTTLAAGIGTTDTTIFLQSTAGMPVNGILTLGGPGGEQVQICAVASGSVTIGHSSCPGTDGRGFAGTTPTAYGAGTFAAMLVNAWYINATDQEMIAVENALGANLSHLTTGTVTSVVAGCGLGGGTITNSGVLSATQTPFYVSNSGYNFAGNCGNFVVRTNAGSMSDTLPQAGSSPWPSGAWMDIQNNGPGTETITPTASQINGHASLVLVSGQGAHIFSDGVNFYALVTGAGTGTVSSVGSGCGLSGGPITGSGTLAASEGSNPQSGGTYTFAGSDCGKIVTRTYSGAASDTLPQATGSFAAGWWMDVQNNGTGAETITPTTSTINGHATLVLQAGQGTHIVSDGTNYQAAAIAGPAVADCHQYRQRHNADLVVACDVERGRLQLFSAARRFLERGQQHDYAGPVSAGRLRICNEFAALPIRRNRYGRSRASDRRDLRGGRINDGHRGGHCGGLRRRHLP